MTATATLPPEVAAYLDQVRAALADVPADERDEMLADLEVSLREGAVDGPPEARLGPPERFAQELRAAAGIESTATPAGRPGLRERLAALAARPRVAAALETARELAPVWWVARGYVAACALALLAGFNWSDEWAFLPVRGHFFGGLLIVLGGIAASVWLGLRARRERWRSRRLTVLNVALAIIALPIGVQAASHDVITGAYFEPAPNPEGVWINGEQVRNLYPYSRDGKLLLDVLLFDEFGHPVDVGSPEPQMDPDRRYLFTRGGQPVLNAFPIRYTEPGTTQVKDPLAAPADIQVPEIKTPPLKVKRP